MVDYHEWNCYRVTCESIDGITLEQAVSNALSLLWETTTRCIDHCDECDQVEYEAEMRDPTVVCCCDVGCS